MNPRSIVHIGSLGHWGKEIVAETCSVLLLWSQLAKLLRKEAVKGRAVGALLRALFRGNQSERVGVSGGRSLVDLFTFGARFLNCFSKTPEQFCSKHHGHRNFHRSVSVLNCIATCFPYLSLSLVRLFLFCFFISLQNCKVPLL